jgi:hypothetical protein
MSALVWMALVVLGAAITLITYTAGFIAGRNASRPPPPPPTLRERHP